MGVPESRGLVLAAREDHPAVGAEDHGPDKSIVAKVEARRGRDFADEGGAIKAAGEHSPAVGWNATEETVCRCRRIVPTDSPAEASQSQAVPSMQPATSLVPSGLKATAFTQLLARQRACLSGPRGPVPELRGPGRSSR